MKEKRFAITPGILAIAAGSLIAGMFCAMAFEAFAFVGPSANPASGAGAVGSDAANEVSIGTSTPLSGTALLVVGSTTTSGTNGFKVEESNGTAILLLRDDGAVSIETSTLSAGNTIIGGNLTVGGTLSAPNLSGGTSISAGNVSSGQFGSGTGGGNYSFPASMAVGTTTNSAAFSVTAGTTTALLNVGNVTVPNALYVATSGNVVIGTTTVPAGNVVSSKLNVYGNMAMVPNGVINGTIDFGAADATSALILYDGGAATTNWGWGLNSGQMEFYGTAGSGNGNVISFNSGGALQANGTNQKMTLNLSTGDLGIGTSTPSALLDIYSSATANTLDTGGQVTIKSANSATPILTINSTAGGPGIAVQSSGVTTAEITQTGNISAGTSTAPSTLTIFGNVQFNGSSSVVTTAIGGSSLATSTCASATISVDSTIATTTAFVVEPTTWLNPAFFNWGAQWSSSGVISYYVCNMSSVSAETPTSTTYVIKIIK